MLSSCCHLRPQLSELASTDEATGQFVEGLPRRPAALVALADASEVRQPGDRPLHHVTDLSQAAAVRHGAATLSTRGQQRNDATLHHLRDDVGKTVTGISTTD